MSCGENRPTSLRSNTIIIWALCECAFQCASYKHGADIESGQKKLPANSCSNTSSRQKIFNTVLPYAVFSSCFASCACHLSICNDKIFLPLPVNRPKLLKKQLFRLRLSFLYSTDSHTPSFAVPRHAFCSAL